MALLESPAVSRPVALKPVETRTSKPVTWFAAVGAGVLVLMAYLAIRWLCEDHTRGVVLQLHGNAPRPGVDSSQPVGGGGDGCVTIAYAMLWQDETQPS